MKLSENRVLAWVVLVLVIVLSVFGLGGARLSRERKAVLDTFYEGTQDGSTRESMDAYLDRARECAQVMASEAQLHFGSDDATASGMLEALSLFGDDAGLDERYDAYLMLKKLSDDLYNKFYADNVPEADRVNFKHAYDDFWGADKFVQRDGYPDSAREFNERLDKFPASAVAVLWGMDELNTFGG